MEKLEKIVKFLDEYLKIQDIKDASWNGLQVEGKENVNKIAFTENACIDTFNKAAKEKADFVIVHHGQFWNTTSPVLRGGDKERIKILISNKISLYTAHLPLDRHREVGNNAQLLKLLGAKITEEFVMTDGKNVGWIGEFKNAVPVEDIIEKLNSGLNTKCRTLLFGREKIKTIAVCSGGGNYDDFDEAVAKNADLYLTGDAIDIYPLAKDAKFNVLFAGHYATETVGLKALMDVIKKKFKVKTIFIDEPTGF